MHKVDNAAAARGQSVATRRDHARRHPLPRHRSRPVHRSRSLDTNSRCAGMRWPISPASCIGWRYRRSADAPPGALAGGRAPMEPARAEDLLTCDDPRRDHRRPARLRAVLSAGLLPGAPRRNPRGLARRHVLSRRLSRRRGGGSRLLPPQRLPILRVADAMALAAPIGLFFGRIANFINAELWGRPTDLPWAVIFPGEAAQTCAGIGPGPAPATRPALRGGAGGAGPRPRAPVPPSGAAR